MWTTPRCRPGRLGSWILVEQLLLEEVDRGAGFDTELFSHNTAHLCDPLQRFRPPAAAMQRGDQ